MKKFYREKIIFHGIQLLLVVMSLKLLFVFYEYEKKKFESKNHKKNAFKKNNSALCVIKKGFLSNKESSISADSIDFLPEEMRCHLTGNVLTKTAFGKCKSDSAIIDIGTQEVFCNGSVKTTIRLPELQQVPKKHGV